MKTAKGIIIVLLILSVILSLIACMADSHAPAVPKPDNENTAEPIANEDNSSETDPGSQASAQKEEPQEKPEEPAEPSEEPEEEPQDPGANTTPAEPEIPEDERLARVTKRNIDPDKPMVALTFDDGPDPEYTEKILDLLAEHGAVATFFEVGNIAERYPDLIRKELEYDCEVGSHTYSHQNLKAISEDEARAEIDKAIDVFVSITGEPPTLLRPPYGSIGDRDSLAKAPVVTWSVDTEDWKSRDADAILEMIKVEDSLNGKVVLMHSIHGCTYDALDNILDYLDSKGYQCVTVSELAYYKHGELLEPGEFYGYSYFQ